MPSKFDWPEEQAMKPGRQDNVLAVDHQVQGKMDIAASWKFNNDFGLRYGTVGEWRPQMYDEKQTSSQEHKTTLHL